MIIEGAPASPPELARLLAAEQANAGSDDGGVVLPCGARIPSTSTPTVTKPALTALLWTIRELGGGFHMPAVRPQHCIDAYAAIIKATNPDICILPGLTHQCGWTPRWDQGAIRLVKEDASTGLSEVKRILAALSLADPGSDWQLIAVNGADGKPAHANNQTSCALYKGGQGISAGKAVVAETDAGLMAVVPLTVPDRFDCCAKVALAAPLAVRARAFFAKAAADTTPTGALPADALVAYSAPAGLAGNEHYAAFRSACEVEYAPPLKQGSRLKLPYWEHIAARDEALLENFMALGPADVVRQDRSMHWEALKSDEHPEILDDVSGKLADALALRHTSGEPAPRLATTRIVDLVRAVLDPAVLPTVGADDPLPEDGCATSMRAKHAGQPAAGKDTTAQACAANQLAEAMLFARLLSDHWPVLGELRLPR